MALLNGWAVVGSRWTLAANRVAGIVTRAARNVAAAAVATVFLTLLSVSGASAQLLMECIPGAPYSAVTGDSFGNVSISIYNMGNGQGVAGTSVTFASPVGGGGTNPRSVTLQTDAQGQINYTPVAGTPGSFTLTIDGGGIQQRNDAGYDCTPDYVVQAAPPASIGVFSGANQTTGIGMPFSQPLQAQVLDANGDPVAGVTVNFSAPAPGPSVFLSSSTAVTNASGIASVTAVANGEAGSFSVGAATAGLPPFGFNLTSTADPFITSVSPNSGPAAGGTLVTIDGGNLSAITSVTFGQADAVTFTIVNSGRITATTPSSAVAQSVTVSVAQPGFGVGLGNGFTFVAPTISISPATLPGGTGSQNYTESLSASGGTAPYSYAVSGSLPVGVTLTTGGVLTGVPEESGVFPFTVTATDNLGFSGTQAYTLTVAAPTIVLSPVTLPAATGATAYTAQQITATGGAAPYTYTVSSGALPAGMSVSAGGSVSGTPTVSGTFSFIVTATDANGFAGSRSYMLDVAAPAITLSPANLPSATAGTAYGPEQLTASGGGSTHSFNLAAGALPNGLALSPAGVISGTPTQDGLYTLTVRATDEYGFSGSAAYTLSVAAPLLTLMPTTLPDGAAGTAYGPETLTASGGTAPYEYSVSGGSLPAGLGLSTAGVISGTPTVSGTFSATVEVEDALGYTTSRQYSLTIGAPAITVSPSTLPATTAGRPYGPEQMSASGGVGPYSFVLTGGALPAGLNLSASGEVSGTATETGTFTATVTATDSLGFTGAGTLTIEAVAPSIAITPATLPGGTGGAVYGPVQFAASGGAGDYGFTLSSGALPAGLTLGADGTLAGTPEEAGTFTFQVTATDRFGFTGMLATSLVVAAPVIAITPAALPGGTGGVAYGPVGFAASGGAGDYGFTLSSGALPAGLTLSAGGTLAGTPEAAGTFTFEVTATDRLGFSGTASYSLAIGAPVPVASSLTLEVVAGTTATVDLTQGATGGPFTGASIVTPPPPSSGTATVSGSGGSYRLEFAAANDASGTVNLQYTLTNIWGVSAPATLTVTIDMRPDPTKDAEVLGLLSAQTDASQRLAGHQIGNLHNRLERLRDGGGAGGGVRVGVQMDDDAGAMGYAPGQTRPSFPSLMLDPARMADDRDATAGLWTGGFVNFGLRQDGAVETQNTMAGVSVGFDKRLTPELVAGIGLGYGRDTAKIGSNGSRSTAQSFSAAVYGSYAPATAMFIDGIAGYTALDFSNRRFVTPTGDFAAGERRGHQFFGSVSAGYEERLDRLLISPYVRMDAAWSRLGAYEESGGGVFNLAYRTQDAQWLSGVLGVRAAHTMPMDWGTLTSRVRLEYSHDFSGSSTATMAYLGGSPDFSVTYDPLIRDFLSVELGFDARFRSDWNAGVSYRFSAGLNGKGSDHGISLKLMRRF